jgi:hypothetical protein
LPLVNKLQVAVDVYWVDSAAGVRKRNSTISPGEKCSIATQVGHVFVLESRDGKLHRIIYPEFPAREIELEPIDPSPSIQVSAGG